MEDHYGMADLRQFMSSTSLFNSLPPPAPPQQQGDMLSAQQHYEMVMTPMVVGGPGLHHEFLGDSSTSNGGGGASSGGAGFSGVELESGGGGGLGFDGGSGRWPRQETLTLLEIRSRLDSKFKEANHKGPLWDEVSRIMSEEHGYQRTGKKCREKFENLYKYYKKTKEGKAGRQDGKHYRFFRQLEALYGDQTNTLCVDALNQPGNTFYNNQDIAPFRHSASKLSENSLSLSNCSDFGSTSSDEDESGEKEKKRKGRWKSKIKEFIDHKMRKLMEKQEAWLEKMMSGIEQKEQERMLREEEWRKQEVDRMEREQRFWANERAWIEARDAALMEALHKITGKQVSRQAEHDNIVAPPPTFNDQTDSHEITKLIQLRTNMEPRFQQHIGCSDEALWEEIANKMSCMGYDHNAAMCKDKWLSINNYFIKCNNKKRKDSCGNGFDYNFQTNNEVHHGGSYSAEQQQPNNGLRFLMGDNNIAAAENLWDSYLLKPSKGAE